jgi:hypothetical protein
MKSLSYTDIKQALRSDHRFRKLFSEYELEINQFLHNPNCNCHQELIYRIAKEKEKLKKYFPNREVHLVEKIPDPVKTQPPMPAMQYKEEYITINCHVDDIAKEIESLPKSQRKIFQIARWETQATIIATLVNVGASIR